MKFEIQEDQLSLFPTLIEKIGRSKEERQQCHVSIGGRIHNGPQVLCSRCSGKCAPRPVVLLTYSDALLFNAILDVFHTPRPEVQARFSWAKGPSDDYKQLIMELGW